MYSEPMNTPLIEFVYIDSKVSFSVNGKLLVLTETQKETLIGLFKNHEQNINIVKDNKIIEDAIFKLKYNEKFEILHNDTVIIEFGKDLLVLRKNKNSISVKVQEIVKGQYTIKGEILLPANNFFSAVRTIEKI